MSKSDDSRAFVLTGIGFEIARKLGSNGFKTIIAARNPMLGEQAAVQLKEEGMDVEFRCLDVSSDESIRAFATAFARDYPRCDILVNNAGIL